MGDNGGTNFNSAAGERISPAEARSRKAKSQAKAKQNALPNNKIDDGDWIKDNIDQIDKFGPDNNDPTVKSTPITPKFGNAEPSNTSNNDSMPFGKAFRAARNNGLDVFTWRGKKYTTELADPQSQELDPVATPGVGTDEMLQASRKGRDAPPMTPVNGDQFQPNSGMLGGMSLEDALLGALGIGGAGAATYAGIKGKQAINAAGPARQEAAGMSKSTPANRERFSGDERNAYKLLERGDTGAALDIAKKMRNVGMEEEAARIESMAQKAGGKGMIGRGAVKIDDLLTRMLKGAM